jgi:hypothetical protein
MAKHGIFTGLKLESDNDMECLLCAVRNQHVQEVLVEQITGRLHQITN